MRPYFAPLLVASVLVFVSNEGFAAPTCPSGQRPGISGCRGAVAPLKASAVPAPTPPTTPKPRTPMPELRPEQSLLEKADRRLLIEEIARLERLVTKLPRKAPDRARMVLRLGDDYAELAKLAEREATEQDMVAESLRAEIEESERARARPEPAPAGPPRRTVTF